MRIDAIAEYVWLHSKEIEFGEIDARDETLFTSNWPKAPLKMHGRTQVAGGIGS